MSIRTTLRVLLLFVPALSNAQAPDCTALHNGIFYTYWPKSADHFVTILHGDTLTEIAVNLDDTVYYRVNWTDECTFSMQYLSGGKMLSERILQFNKDHIFWNKIDQITEEYFVSHLYQDKLKGRMLKRDTSWFVQKMDVAQSTAFQKLSGPLVDEKTTFADSLNYALVYVYRPSKVMLLLATYPLYFDEQVMCVVQNNSGYIFRINKAGLHRFSTRLFNDEAEVSVHIQFGRKYFLKPTIDWGIKKNGNNFKLRLEEVADHPAATKAFNEVRLR